MQKSEALCPSVTLLVNIRGGLSTGALARVLLLKAPSALGALDSDHWSAGRLHHLLNLRLDAAPNGAWPLLVSVAAVFLGLAVVRAGAKLEAVPV